MCIFPLLFRSASFPSLLLNSSGFLGNSLLKISIFSWFLTKTACRNKEKVGVSKKRDLKQKWCFNRTGVTCSLIWYTHNRVFYSSYYKCQSRECITLARRKYWIEEEENQSQTGTKAKRDLDSLYSGNKGATRCRRRSITGFCFVLFFFLFHFISLRNTRHDRESKTESNHL